MPHCSSSIFVKCCGATCHDTHDSRDSGIGIREFLKKHNLNFSLFITNSFIFSLVLIIAGKMGKQRRARQKFHAVAAKLNSTPSTQQRTKDTAPLLPLGSPVTENIFSGVEIDFNKLKKNLSDETQSVRSCKSQKSENGTVKTQPKKDKLKARREMLLKKIDTVNQMRKQLKIRNKRKNTPLIGDTNPLHDALPSLESLIKQKNEKKSSFPKTIKKKCIEKSARRKKQLVEGVKTFKQTLKNAKFKGNPLKSVTDHIKHIVQSEAKFNKQK